MVYYRYKFDIGYDLNYVTLIINMLHVQYDKTCQHKLEDNNTFSVTF